MKNTQLILLIILFAFTQSFNTKAQSKFDKILEAAAEDYEIGDYPDARSKIDRLKKESIKKYGATSEFMAISLVKEAKYDVALGMLDVVNQRLDSAITISIEANGEYSAKHGLLLMEAAEVLILYGNHNRANEYLDAGLERLEGKPELDEDTKASFDVLKAETLVGRGFSRDAISLINGQMDYFRSRTLVEDQKKRVTRKRKRDYAHMMIFKGNAFRKMGDYLSADSSFVFANNWILDNLKKSDILYSENQFYNTLLLEENGLEAGAVVDLYEKAYVNTVRKYAPSHYVTIRIQERLIKSYMRNSNNAKLKNMETTFKQTIKKYYGKRSINGLILKTLDYDILSGGRDRGLEDKANKILSSEDIIPEFHPKRIDFLEFANKIALVNERSRNSLGYLEEILKIKEILYGDDSPEYNLTKTKIANYYIDYSDKFEEAAEIYEKSFHQIVEKEITEGHLEYVNILDHLALFYEENDQYDKASEILAVALEASRRKYDNRDIEYAIELDKISNLQFKIGLYEEAEKNILEALDIMKESDVENAKSYMAQSLITEASLLAIKGEYDEAEANMNKSEKLQSKGVKTIETSGVDIEDELAEVYLDIGRYKAAAKLIDETLEKRSTQFGENSRHLNDPILLSARHKMIVGDYTAAEKLAKKANDLTKQIFGESSVKTTASSVLLAKIYTTLGDYDKAQNLLENAIDIRTKQFGKNHVDVARATSDLALVKYYNKEEVREVEDLFLTAERVIGKKLGSTNPYYAEILKNLALVYIADKRYDEAFRFLDDAGAIWNSKIGKRNNINAATVNILKGDIYYNKREYNQAENYYQDAKRLYENIFNDNHPEYVKVLSKLSKTYFMQGDVKKSQDALEEVLNNYSTFIKKYFPALSEREKAKFWNTIKQDYEFYNTLVINFNRGNQDLIGTLYDNALLTKALLLSSSIKIRQRILSSGNQELIQTYTDWVDKKELLTKVISMSTQQLLENNINPQLLETEVENLEKALSQKSEDFSSGFESKVVTWENVKGALNPDEVALEMIRFRVFDHNFTDSVMYAVIYLKNEGKNSKPGMVLLNNGKNLETKALKYYRNTTKYKIEDSRSYGSFWEPIATEIGNPSKIFLSADGVYNQINLESIRLEDSTYVLDNSNIILISNTKDLYLNKFKTNVVQESNVAMMFGNPKFYLDSDPGAWTGNAEHRGGNPDVIGRLPGTQEEIVEVKDLLRYNGWVTNDFTDKGATESEIKKINNPKLFHIATHGFFQPNLELNSDEIGLRDNLVAENPLLKTGLLMSGAGDILNQTTANFNLDDGILTAFEAMNLNLDNTELVILSACETGLGEIEAGEGVYGLQRAFLVAGAKTIVMSLFKVSDEATQKLMVLFYKKWLATGNKRESFIQAKIELREEFPEPIYWGAFIMIGLN